MRVVGLTVLLLATVGALGAPGRARAQYFVRNTSSCETPIGCDRADCGVISTLLGAVCGSFDEGPDGMSGLVFCHPACGTIFDCQAGPDPRCPVLGGELGVCGGRVDSRPVVGARRARGSRRVGDARTTPLSLEVIL